MPLLQTKRILPVILAIFCSFTIVCQGLRAGLVANFKYSDSIFGIFSPQIVVDLHGSKATMNRVESAMRTFGVNPHVNKEEIFIQAIFSKLVNVSLDFPMQTFNCNDDREGVQGLTCRVQESYYQFLSSYPKSPWLFRATDDVWIEISNLQSYIRKLNRIYNPYTQIVLKAHANREDMSPFTFIHGGPGWIMSRAYIEHRLFFEPSLYDLQVFSRYFQDDTAESIVVGSIFQNHTSWGEPLIVGFLCENCAEDMNSANLTCDEDTPLYRVRDIIALHLFGGDNRQLALAKAIKSAHKDFMYSVNSKKQTMRVCIKREEPSYNASIGQIKQNAQYINARELERSSIDIETLGGMNED